MAQEGLRPPVNPGDMKISGKMPSAGLGESKLNSNRGFISRIVPWLNRQDEGNRVPVPIPTHPTEERSLEERFKVTDIKEGIPTAEDANRILHWASDPEIRGHLVPAPRVPVDWNDEREVGRCEQELIHSYKDGYERGDITPLIAVNHLGEAIGVAKIRWRNDKYLRLDGKTAVVEGQITAKEHQNKGVGTAIMHDIMHRAFVQKKMERLKLWTMTDVTGWENTYKFYRTFNFRIDRGPYRHYEDLVRERGFDEDRPEALLLSLRSEDAAAFLRLQGLGGTQPDETEILATPDRKNSEESPAPQAAS